MNKAILEAVTQFTEFKFYTSDKNYKLSAMVKLCEACAARASYNNTNMCSGDFYDFLFSFSDAELEAISDGRVNI